MAPQAYVYQQIATERTVRILELKSASKFNAKLEGSIKELTLPPCSSREALIDKAKALGLSSVEDLNDAAKDEVAQEMKPYEKILDNKKDSFSVISHSWEADAQRTMPLLCDGKVISITPNLDNALRHLRQPKKSMRLWLDDVCVDAASIADRNDQAELAGLIFKLAKSLLVWLGDDLNVGEEDDAASKISKRRKSKPKLPSKPPIAASFPPELVPQLLRSTWLAQLHTVQEQVITERPQAILVRNGAYESSYEHLMRVISAEHEREGGDQTNEVLCRARKTLGGCYRSQLQDFSTCESVRRRNQLLALQCNRLFTTIDAKERLYSIRTLLTDLGLPVPHIGWSKPPNVIWDEFLRGCLRESRSLWLLLANQNDTRDTTVSWTLDWTTQGFADAVALTRNTELLLGSTAAASTSQLDLPTLASSRSGELALKGKLVSDVLWSGRKFPLRDPATAATDPAARFEAYSAFRSWFSWALELEALDALERIVLSRNADAALAPTTLFTSIPELASIFGPFVPYEWQATGSSNLKFFRRFWAGLRAAAVSAGQAAPWMAPFWERVDADPESRRMLGLIWSSLQGGVLFADSAGRLGIAWGGLPPEIKPGQRNAPDRRRCDVVLLAGSDVPVLLTPAEGSNGSSSPWKYKLLGPAFVTGLMQGEAWSSKIDVRDLDTFILC